MTDTKRLHAAVVAQRTKLEGQFPSGFTYITSEDNWEKNSVAGTTAEVDLQTAAKHLIQRTAHLSSEAEIDAFRAAGQRCIKDMVAMELARHPLAPLITTGPKK